MSIWLFFGLLVIVNSAIWVYFDASRLRDAYHTGVGPMGLPAQTWAAIALLLWPFGFAYYFSKRSLIEDLERRSGPPPRFVTEGLNAFAVVVGLLGFAIFGGLLFLGELKISIVGLVVAAVGIFGGRKTHMTREQDRVELGSIGFDQIGFAAPNPEDSDQGEAPADLEQYFTSMASPAGPAPPQPAASQPATPLPAAPLPAAPQPTAPLPAAPQPTAPQPAASYSSPPSQNAPARPSTPAHGVPYSPTGGPTTAPSGISYSPSSNPPPADSGRPYSPPPIAGSAPAPPEPAAPQPPIPQKVAPQQPTTTAPPLASPQPPIPQPAAPQPAAPQPAAPPSGPNAPPLPSSGTPYTPPAVGQPYSPPPITGPGDPKATVALSHSAIQKELRSSGLEAPTPQAPPVSSSPSVQHPPAAVAPPPAAQPEPPQALPKPPTPQPSARALQGPASAPPSLGAMPAPSAPPQPSPQPPSPRPPSPRPQPPRSSGRNAPVPARGSFVAKRKSVPPILPVLGILLALAAVAGAGWYFWGSFVDDGDTELAEAAEPETLAEDETPAPQTEDVEAASQSEAEPREATTATEAQGISTWTESYSQWMSPMAHSLDEIDFDGMSADRCRQLQSSLRSVEKNLDPCPDKEVDELLVSALPLLHGAANACRGQDETEWAENLVEAKKLTHRAQVLLDKKYRFAGISELELESAIGVQRSPESISGRWLLAQQSDDFFDVEGEAGEEDFGDDFEDSEEGFEDDFADDESGEGS